MLQRVRKHAPHAIEHASIFVTALKRLIKPPSPREATGVFRAATGVAAAPQRGANPSFFLRYRYESGRAERATEELGVGFRCWSGFLGAGSGFLGLYH